MKKRWMILCAGLLALNLAACGGNEDAGQTQESREETAAPEESSPESGGTSEEESSQEPSDSETPAGGAGSGESQGWSEEMEGLKAAVVELLGDDYWPDAQMLPDMLEMSFGITADMYEDYMAESPMISANVDTLLIVKAKDDKVEAVQGAVEAYREAKVNDTMQYPMNLGKIQASRIETIGNYVMFVQLGADTTDAAEEGDEAVVAQCQEVNDQVIETVRALLEGAAQ